MRNIRHSKSVWLAGASALVVGLVGPMAAAQDDSDESPRTLSTVTVTTQKTEESIQDVPIAVSAFDEDALDRGLADDRRAVAGDIDDAAPLSQHSNSTKHWKQLDNCADIAFNYRKTSPLTITHVGVDTCTNDQLALVGLTDITVDCVGHYDGVQYRFQWL